MSKNSWAGVLALLGSLAAVAAKPVPSATYVDSVRKAHTKHGAVVLQDTVRFDTDFESGSLGGANLRYADSSKAGVHHIYKLISRADPKNPFDPTYQTSGRWFFFRMVGVANKTIHLLFQNTDPMAPVYSYDGVHFERIVDCAPYRARQRFDRDTAYVAYCVPYTHDRLATKIAQWQQSPHLQSVEVVGFSEQKRPIYLLTVRDTSVAESAKKQLYIHARIHPSETPISFVLEGFVDALLQSKLLQQISCYIVPFANPDGVAGGFSRSNAVGVNLELNFANATSPTQKESQTILRLVDKLGADQPLDMALNLHAQVAPKMMFWLHTAASTSQAYYEKELSFFHTATSHNPLLNRADSVYSAQSNQIIEHHFWERSRGQTLALTLEESYSHYNTTPLIWATPERWTQSGQQLLEAVGDFLLQPDAAKVLIKAYPKMVLGCANNALILANGKKIPLTDTEAQSIATPYVKGLQTTPPTHDPGRVRSQALLQAMYGASPQEVLSSLVTIKWCPKLFKNQKMRVTTKNNVHLALQRISDELQEHPEWKKYLTVDGSYNWRVIQNTTRLSPHSYGIAVDIGGKNGHYWLWDHPAATETSKIPYRNEMPEGIVAIFEKHGFIWGGKWHHYDTMHFEYRPELLVD